MMFDAARYGPWAVIPGGSESLGAWFARRLADAGLNLVLIARKEGPLSEVADEILARGTVAVRTLALDLARDDVLERVRSVTDDIEVGLLLYNAGAAHRTGPLLGGTAEDMLRTIAVNVVSQARLVHHFGERMVARGRGGIVTIGSLAGTTGTPGVVTYAGAKAFSQIFAEGLWVEWRPLGVDVLHVLLGAVNTPAMARLGIFYPEDQLPSDPEVHSQEILDQIANGPVFVPPHLVETYRHSRSLGRREAVVETAERLGAFTGDMVERVGD